MTRITTDPSPASTGPVEGAWLESLLERVPVPLILIATPSGRVVYANPPADEMAGGEFPLGAASEQPAEGPRFTFPDGRPIPPAEMPAARAARGERLRSVELDWHIAGTTRSLLVSTDMLPAQDDHEELAIVCFDDVTPVRRLERHLGAILRDIGDGVYTVDGEGRLTGMNSRAGTMLGYTLEDLFGRNTHEAIHHTRADGTPYPQSECPLLGTRHSGQIVHVDDEVFIRADGSMLPVAYTSSPLVGPDGEPGGAVIVFHDTTEQRRAEREREELLASERRARERASFLAEAGRTLHASLDFEQTLRRITNLLVPAKADLCSIDLLEPGRRPRLRRLTLAQGSGKDGGVAGELFENYPPRPGEPSWEVLESGRTLVLDEIPAELVSEVAQDEHHRQLIRQLGARSAVFVPMRTGDRALGTLTLVSTSRTHAFEPADVELFEELARRAAVAIDHARVYRQRDHIARTLQAGLMPTRIPHVPGVRIAHRFVASGDGIEVGGDFLDVFEVAHGSYAVVLGDVCGKGPEAAALTALMRHTVRVASRYEPSPADALAALNRAILAERLDGRFATAVVARLHANRDRVSVKIASGAHPPPVLLRRNSTSEPVGRPGYLLGVEPGLEFPQSTIGLEPGDCLIFYTDGLTEAGAPEAVLSAEDIGRLAAQHAGRGPEAIAAGLEAAARALCPGELRDDLALVVVEATGEVEPAPPSDG